MSSVDSYRIKRIRFFSRKVPILCQNENGPCPLLAIGNILLLQSNISIHPDLSEITFSELTQLVAGYLLDSNPPHEDLRINANQQTQLDTVIKLLPRLQYGLDVNVRFNSTRGFEFTEEMAAFDMTGTTLLHGWILDPEDKHTVAVIDGMSYNKLVEKLLDFRSIAGEASDPGVLHTVGTTGDSGDSAENCDVSERDGAEQAEPPFSASPGGKDTPGQDEGVSVEPGAVVGDVDEEVGVHACNVNACNPSGGGPSTRTEGSDDGGNAKMDETTTAVIETSSTEQLLGQVGGAPDTGIASSSDQVTDAESVKVAKVLKEGQVAEDFFRETASQLTYYGLSRLHQEVRDRQLCVFFRNNHFSTLFKYDGKLYLLITDLGYARESSVVWEKLDQIDGDTEYVDSDFTRSSRCSLANADHTAHIVAGQHDDQDYMLALALQEEDASSLASRAPSANNQPTVVPGAQPGQDEASTAIWGDEAVALALQQEERALLEQQREAATNAESRDGQRTPFREEGMRRPSGLQERRRQAESTRATCSIQ